MQTALQFSRSGSLALLLASACTLFAGPSPAAAQPAARPDRTRIVFGYMQSTAADGPLASYRWHALTHVGFTQVSFQSDGKLTPAEKTAFMARSPELLPGGAAANSGVKVVAVLMNNGYNAATLSSVMEDPARRQSLITEVTALVADPVSGCDGVSLDFQPVTVSSSAALRLGVQQFVTDLAASLRALTPRRELSIYLGPRSVSVYDMARLRTDTDFMLYSAYDTAPGSTVQAVAAWQASGSGDGMLNGIDAYMQAGMPPEQIVLTLPLYGRPWATGTAAFGATGVRGAAVSWNKTNFDTNWRATPLTRHASDPDAGCKWYAEATGGTPAWNVTTYDDLETLERKMRLALDWKGSVNPGVQLGGVGFWNLMWLANGLEPASTDPNDPAHVANPLLRRTACEPWSLMEELFAPGGAVWRAEEFEGLNLNPRWRDPNEGPDALNAGPDCAVAMTAAPAGAPEGSERAAALTWQFTSTPNRLLFKHQVLGDLQAPWSVDHGSALVRVPAATRFLVDVHVPAPAPGLAVRMVVMDGERQLERSLAFDLSEPGWRQLEWNLADASTVFPYATAEGGFSSGDGRLDTTGDGGRDVSFIGFELTSAAASTGTVHIDRIRYASASPVFAAAGDWTLYE